MGDDQDKDLLDELAADFMMRRRRGETPTISEYTEEHPDLAEEIRDLFPTIAALEEFKTHRERSPDGRVETLDGNLIRLDEFSVTGEIGRGGMGVVYEAVENPLGRNVALKLLPSNFLASGDALERFQREARIVARLQHPGIVPIYRFGKAEGHHYIAMQRIRGVGWDRLINRLSAANQGESVAIPEADVDQGQVLRYLAQSLFSRKSSAEPERTDSPWRLPLAGKPFRFGVGYPAEVAQMGLQATEALHYAHCQGVWHRDIKPGNLILDEDGRVWITDFGLAKMADSETLTTAGRVMGTLRFMAPENFDSRNDARSDVYSLGLSLYELLTLQPAFRGDSQSEMIRRILHEPPLAPRSINPDIPPQLEAILLCATSKSPVARYSSALAMAKDLERFLSGKPVLAAINETTALTTASPTPSRFRSIGRAIVAGLLLAALALAAVFFFDGKKSPAPISNPAHEKEAPAPIGPEPEPPQQVLAKPESQPISQPDNPEVESVLETIGDTVPDTATETAAKQSPSDSNRTVQSATTKKKALLPFPPPPGPDPLGLGHLPPKRSADGHPLPRPGFLPHPGRRLLPPKK